MTPTYDVKHTILLKIQQGKNLDAQSYLTTWSYQEMFEVNDKMKGFYKNFDD